MTHVIVVGTSEPQDFQLQDNGANLVGTGLTIALEFRETSDELDDVLVAWLDQAAGTVRVTGTEGLIRGTYHVRFKLTDLGGKVGYVPNLQKPSDEWLVVRV